MSDPAAADAAPSLRAALGGAVQRLRVAAGLSQDAFAVVAGVHRTYVGSVERGEVNVSLDNLERLARGLGVPLSVLFAEVEADPRPASGRLGRRGRDASAPS